jgi:hypothetical protein
MKPAVPALVSLINTVIAGTAAMCDWDLYTVTDFAGNVYRYTTADFPINCGSGTNAGGLPQPSGVYSPVGVRVDQRSSKTQAHWKVGLDADQWTVVMMPRPFDLVTGATFPDMIGSVPFLQALQAGAWDAADVQVDRAYFSSVPTWPMPAGGAVPVGTITIFAGLVAEVDTTDAVAVVTINDYRSLTSFSMPRHYFQGMCRHQLFDVGCNANGNMNPATFAVSCTAGAGSTQSSIVIPGITPPANSSGTFSLGKLQFTSGLNENFWGFIKQWDGVSTLSLIVPMPFSVAPGDTFVAYPGCDKTEATCTAFNNFPQFGGEPLIPVPETMASGN